MEDKAAVPIVRECYQVSHVIQLKTKPLVQSSSLPAEVQNTVSQEDDSCSTGKAGISVRSVFNTKYFTLCLCYDNK